MEDHSSRGYQTGSSNSSDSVEGRVSAAARCAGKMLVYFGRKKEESWSMKNSRMLLEQSISLFDGKVNPIRCFSVAELKIATDNFNQDNVLLNHKFTLYRGFLRDKEIIVKKNPSRYASLSKTIHDIVIASRLSVHKNVLKLIGACLETEVPMAVYESFHCDGTLYDELLRDDQRPSFAWKHRLKIAVNLSNLVAYLHTALPRPFIHRDLRLSNILLDKENGVVKMFSFELCISLPEGKSFIEDEGIAGTPGYLDPEYASLFRFNEKADVFSFGVILLVLLSGENPIRYMHTDEEGGPKSLIERAIDCAQKNEIFEFMDPRLSAVGPWLGKDGQFEALLMLALECTRYRGEDRPDMTEVGTKVAEMYRAFISCS